MLRHRLLEPNKKPYYSTVDAIKKETPTKLKAGVSKQTN